MKTNKTKLIWTILISIFSVEIAIFLVGIVLFKKPSFLKDFSGLALSKKPETFTELFFTDHLKLPKTISLYHEYSFHLIWLLETPTMAISCLEKNLYLAANP